MLRRLWQYRDLVVSFVRRQFQIRYRQSAAGFLWAVVPAVMTVFVGKVVFEGVAGISTGAVPYPIFAFAAVVPWTLFASSLTFGVPSIVNNFMMVTRLPFPRAVLPLSAIGLALVDMGLAGIAYVIYAIASGWGIPLSALWFPLLLLLEIVLAAGVVFLGSGLNVFARDVKLVVPLVTQVWLFLTPVMYPLDQAPDSLQPFFKANPMTGLIESFRNVLVYGTSPEFMLLIPSIVGAAVLFTLGTWYFRATEPRFADVI